MIPRTLSLLSSSVANPEISFNPSSLQEEAREGSIRKWKNLNLAKKGLVNKNKTPVLNFGGQISELIYPGGEIPNNLLSPRHPLTNLSSSPNR